jgi:hypothetical protein
MLGVYGVSASGLRFGSGTTVGLFGAVVGIHWSLGLSAAAMCVGTILAGFRFFAITGGGADRW